MSNEYKPTFTTRKVPVFLTDNGTPYAYSATSYKNFKVYAEVQPPLQLPGLIIFVHGVNSEGEWYKDAEAALCKGLNERLGFKEGSKHSLSQNTYAKADWNDDHTKWIVPPRKIIEEGRSPVIRFYWGYRSADHETDSYAIPLKNKRGDNYYDLSPEERKSKGPWYWGGGPFQNGCNQLVSLFKQLAGCTLSHENNGHDLCYTN
ncbi:hypothetical protein [Pseudescherichia sp.]|uniref:T6SS effector phospholipase Tle3 domain-containing protein n=1 Tax=Pseudescherichia sp. TaxID=2055881 RepID=UPI0028AF4934|nr:hypothetical protein [Pseudescherichia sp.]